jgi:hypothetical protein
VAVRPDGIFNVTASFPTMRELCEAHDLAASPKDFDRRRLSGMRCRVPFLVSG